MSYTCLVDICNSDDELVLVTWNPRTWARSWFDNGGSCGGLVDMFQENVLGSVSYFPIG